MKLINTTNLYLKKSEENMIDTKNSHSYLFAAILLTVFFYSILIASAGDNSFQTVWSYSAEEDVLKAVSAEDGSVVFITNNYIRFLNNTGILIWKEKARDGIKDIDISANGKYVGAVIVDSKWDQTKNGVVYYNTINLFNNNGKLLWMHNVEGNKVSFSSDGEYIQVKSQVFDLRGKRADGALFSNKVADFVDWKVEINGKRNIVYSVIAPIVEYPKEGTIEETTPTFKWSKLVGANKYIIKIDGIESEVFGNSYSVDKPLNAGNHSLNVKAVYSDGKQSRWGKEIVFTILPKNVETVIDTKIVFAGVILSVVLVAIFSRPYYKRAKLKREMAQTPTDWCPHCKKFTGGAKVCPHCGKETLVSVTYDISKKAKKK